MNNIKLGTEAAQVLALQALTWLVQQDDLLQDFFSETGVSPADLAQLAQTPSFLGAVLDFLLQDDRRIIDFCTSVGAVFESVQAARFALLGGQHIHWT